MVLILEDDIEFCVDAAAAEEALRPLLTGTVPFDIVMLAYNDKRTPPLPPVADIQPFGLGRPNNYFAGAAYLVHRNMYDRLLELLKASVGKRAPDVAWLPLQRDLSVRFYYCLTRIGRQRPGYSDIQRKEVNYKGV
jgi:hypothetical protein